MDMENKTLNIKWIEWFVGFCDADANFQVFPKIRKGLNNSIYYNIGYGFHISLSIKDLELLKKIKYTLGRGTIYEYLEKNEARLAITKLKDLNWLIENVFEKCSLITKHQRDRYFIFKNGILTKKKIELKL